jgi:hypothetical protein
MVTRVEVTAPMHHERKKLTFSNKYDIIDSSKGSGFFMGNNIEPRVGVGSLTASFRPPKLAHFF